MIILCAHFVVIVVFRYSYRFCRVLMSDSFVHLFVVVFMHICELCANLLIDCIAIIYLLEQGFPTCGTREVFQKCKRIFVITENPTQKFSNVSLTAIHIPLLLGLLVNPEGLKPPPKFSLAKICNTLGKRLVVRINVKRPFYV